MPRSKKSTTKPAKPTAPAAPAAPTTPAAAPAPAKNGVVRLDAQRGIYTFDDVVALLETNGIKVEIV